MSKHRLACLCLLLVSPGCSFDPPPLDPGDPGDRPDARPGSDDGGPVDAGSVPDANPECDGTELVPSLRVDGTLVPEGQQGPVVEVLLGDLVEISAAGSCGGDGALSYEWTIMSEDGPLDTAEPALTAGPETFTVYPTAAGDYTVTLTVRAGGASADTSVLAIRAHAWQAATVPTELNMGEVRDLAVGGGNLWIASLGGAFFLPLAGPPDDFTLVEANGDSVPNDLRVVFFGGDTELWFGRAADENGPWRLDTTVTPPESVQISWDDALDGTAQTFDIASFEGIIIAATSEGVTSKDPSEDLFGGQTQPNDDNPRALAMGDGRQLAGAKQIYDLALPQQFDSGLALEDNRIRAMVIDEPNQDLWVGTDDNGVASFDLRTNTPIAVYNDANSGLGSNRVRALVMETDGPYAGDVWAATSTGVSRYIRKRDTWIHMNADHGLTGHVDLLSLAIDTDQGRRAIYGGSRVGVVYIRKP